MVGALQCIPLPPRQLQVHLTLELPVGEFVLLGINFPFPHTVKF